MTLKGISSPWILSAGQDEQRRGSQGRLDAAQRFQAEAAAQHPALTVARPRAGEQRREEIWAEEQHSH